MSGNSFKNALLRGFPASFNYSLTWEDRCAEFIGRDAAESCWGAASALPASPGVGSGRRAKGSAQEPAKAHAEALAVGLTQLAMCADICKLPYTFVNVLVCLSKPISGINFVLLGG